MSVTESGINTHNKSAQPENEDSSMLVTPSGIDTRSAAAQSPGERSADSKRRFARQSYHERRLPGHFAKCQPAEVKVHDDQLAITHEDEDI